MPRLPSHRLLYWRVILTAAVIRRLWVTRWPSIVHPMNLNPNRAAQVEEMLGRRATAREDFSVRAADGAELRGWKVRARSPNGNWIILFHGVSDNRSGVLGYAELLLRHGYNVVMMDSRAHGGPAIWPPMAGRNATTPL